MKMSSLPIERPVLVPRFAPIQSESGILKSNEPTKVVLELQDVLHTFQKGHRVMIQVQSTWFPLVDRNPQKWVENIYRASDADFTAARHRVWREPAHATFVEVGVLPPEPAAPPAGG